MMNKKNTSRRNFLKQSSFGLGAGMAGLSSPSLTSHGITENKKIPREITVASVDLVGWPDKTTEARVKRMLGRMEDIAGLQPDVVCLPELFDTMWVSEKRDIADIAEDENAPGPITSRVAEFAKKHSCYVICPVVTKKEGNFYNSSILLDRKGKIAGVYHKIHPVKSEISPDQAFKGGGVIPGAVDQPVIETDFGKVGMLICYDANWTDGWDNLKRQGTDIVFFSSAFPGGRMLNHYALRNNCYIVSSTGGDARIVDVSGNDLDSSSEFVRYAWANINLEKENVTEWPMRDRLPDIFKKYGDRVGIKAWRDTNIITVESRDPELKVADVLKEFNIPTYSELIRKETAVQQKYRPN